MKNTNETMFRLMNHDGSPTGKPIFHRYTLAEYNRQFQTNYQTIEEAICENEEYLFTQADMTDYCRD